MATGGTSNRAPLLVMAVGNLLRQDDGVAETVLRALEQGGVPDGVELLDAGTSAIDLLDVFADRRKLVVIDAVRGGRAPGTLYRFCPEQVAAEALPMNSLHQVGLLETLKLGALIDCQPQETVVIGIEPGATGLGIGLSAEVAAAVPRALELVRAELPL